MSDGRYTPNNGHLVAAQYLSLRANNDISHCGKLPAISGQSTDVRRGIPYGGELYQVAERAAADVEELSHPMPIDKVTI